MVLHGGYKNIENLDFQRCHAYTKFSFKSPSNVSLKQLTTGPAPSSSAIFAGCRRVLLGLGVTVTVNFGSFCSWNDEKNIYTTGKTISVLFSYFLSKIKNLALSGIVQ